LLIIAVLAVDLDAFTAFFQSTLDTDHDGHFGILDWVSHFNLIEPDHSFNHTHLQETFDLLDENADGRVYIEEMLQQLSKLVGTSIVIKQKFGPKQIHLGLTGNNGEMQVMWITQPDKAFNPVVHYGPNIIGLNNTKKA
jgi:Ca2+-binding EF-hand superfamily protein